MCLHTVDQSNLDISGEGYKIFALHDHGLVPLIFSNVTTELYEIGKWYKADKAALKANDGNSYMSGFHILLPYEGIEELIARKKSSLTRLDIRKVKYNHGHTIGKQKPLKVVVADEMMILPEET